MLTLRTMTAWGQPRQPAASRPARRPEPRRATPVAGYPISSTAEAPPIRLWPLGEGAGGGFDASLAALAARLHCGRDNGD